ncbi:MAG: tyrosine-protein phosphatase [Clostridia bacterium]|nr:tyrosine-protein phosphatase [Clostridia bacterium]
MKKLVSLFLCFALLSLAVSVCAESTAVTGKVTEIEKYGHARLDITIDDFNAAGFALGDIVTVKTGSFEGEMPYFDGYYVDNGEYMVRAYPGHENIAVCINYGSFADTAGIAVGDEVTIELKEKGGTLAFQQINALTYTDLRADYESDEIFANFRSVKVGDIGEGKLYRSASPVNDEHSRSATANRLIEEAGIRAVMNMADTDEEVLQHASREGFDSAYYMDLYRSGHVIALGMPILFTTGAFAESIVKGLTFLSGEETPFLVHCTEGKDRAGFGSMILEALMGASEEEIVSDYLASYINYYHLDPAEDAEKLEMIAEKNVREMLRAVAGLEKGASLKGVDLAAAAESYLTAHGMEPAAIEALKDKLK